MEYMPIYQYVLETEFEKYHYYFSYEATTDHVLEKTYGSFSAEVDLFDIFPEPHVKKGVLKEPLKIITKIGKEMYLPVGMKVQIHSKYRFLFNYSDAPL